MKRVTLSNHARLRCDQMGVAPEVARMVAGDPDITYSAGGGRIAAVAAGLAVILEGSTVVTVLWAGKTGR